MESITSGANAQPSLRTEAHYSRGLRDSLAWLYCFDAERRMRSFAFRAGEAWDRALRAMGL